MAHSLAWRQRRDRDRCARQPLSVLRARRRASGIPRLDDSPVLLAFLAQVHTLSGNKSEAAKVLQDLEEQAKRRYVCSYEVATAFVLLGKSDPAFRWFDKAIEDRSDCMVMLVVDPRLDSIRSDDRYPVLVRRVGLWQ